MLKWVNNNILYLGVITIIFTTCFLLFKQDLYSAIQMIAVLIMAIISIAIISKKRNAIYAIIILAPISIPLPLELLNLRLSFPTEFLTLLLIITSGTLLFITEKYNKQIVYHPIAIILLLLTFHLKIMFLYRSQVIWTSFDFSNYQKV